MTCPEGRSCDWCGPAVAARRRDAKARTVDEGLACYVDECDEFAQSRAYGDCDCGDWDDADGWDDTMQHVERLRPTMRAPAPLRVTLADLVTA